MKKQFAGFTLIEIIVVIGIIAILAAIVIIAVNPARQFGSARNAQRFSHTREIRSGVRQQAADLNGGTISPTIPKLPKSIGTTAATDPLNFVDLTALLTPSYLASLPFDPNGGSLADSKYVIFSRGNDGVVLAPNADLNRRIVSGTDYGIQPDGASSFGVLPNDPSYDFASFDDFTISFWIKPDPSFANLEDASIIEKRVNNVSVNMPFTFRWSAIWKSVKFARFNGNPVSYLVAAKDLNDNQWHHIVATAQGSNPSSILSLYIDGVFNTGPWPVNLSGASTSTGSLIGIGARPNNMASCSTPPYAGCSGMPSTFFRGGLHGLSIYNRVLTATEITNLYKGFPINNGLIAYWGINDGSDVAIGSATNNLQNGYTINNPTWVTFP